MKKSKFTEGQIAFALKQADTDPPVEEVCRKMRICQATFYAWRKKHGGLDVAELDALTAIADERDFEVVAEHVREAIEKYQPEGGLDRLHTLVNKFIRVTCEPRGITITRDKPLHSVFGEYVKALREDGHLESARPSSF